MQLVQSSLTGQIKQTQLYPDQRSYWTLYEVQHILGHTQVKTTQRYAHLSHDTLLAATNSVNTALGGMFMPMVSASPASQVQLVQ